MNGIVQAQSHGWFVILAPLGMLIFFISSTAEIGRSPFDLLEADSEIVAGYNIEYSGMRLRCSSWASGSTLLPSAA